MTVLPLDKVTVHPLVLLSVVDHYNRVARDTKKRVVGVLLGSVRGRTLDISNSFAVPFEEDDKDLSVWYLDHNYLENMYAMFKKVNAKEKLVGWYHTGPKLRQNDLEINELLRRYTPSPCLCIIDVKPKALGLPTDAYVAIEEIHDDGTPTSKTFEHVQSEIGAEEAEEIGVEHLLRDIKDSTAGTLAQRISNQLNSVRGLHSHLKEIHEYLLEVAEGKLPVSNQITYEMQDIFNLLPNLNVEELVQSFSVKTNDQMLVIYLSAMVRSIIALHNLINNKIANREQEKSDLQGATEKEEKPKKDLEEQDTATDKPDMNVTAKESG
eukprot:comp19392_c0_seq1/m.22413 comp19392_c0_seq1/g.22413  ORF comp19392_c0_seq1/g.22413 comp19392_c0_seq1/m.22413 type:complete len:324 (-) comp19392_c0_seq1:238-1209(-)